MDTIYIGCLDKTIKLFTIDNIKLFIETGVFIFGGVIAYNAAFRELKFGRLQKSLDNDYELRKQIYLRAVEISSKYNLDNNTRNDNNPFLDDENIVSAINDLKGLSDEAEKCTREIANLSCLLYQTILSTYKTLKKETQDKLQFKEEFCNLIIDTVNQIKIYSIKITFFPNFWQIISPLKKMPLSNNTLNKLYNKTNYKSIKTVEFGVNLCGHCEEISWYVCRVNAEKNNDLSYALGGIINLDEYLVLLMFEEKIYFPSKIRFYIPGVVDIPGVIGSNNVIFKLMRYERNINLVKNGNESIKFYFLPDDRCIRDTPDISFKEFKNCYNIYDEFNNRNVKVNSNFMNILKYKLYNLTLLEIELDISEARRLYSRYYRCLKRKVRRVNKTQTSQTGLSKRVCLKKCVNLRQGVKSQS